MFSCKNRKLSFLRKGFSFFLLLCCVLFALCFIQSDASESHTHHDHHNHIKENTEKPGWEEFWTPGPFRTAVYNSVLSTILVGFAPILCIFLVVSTDEQFLNGFFFFFNFPEISHLFFDLFWGSMSVLSRHLIYV